MPELSWFEDYGSDHYYGYDMTQLQRDQAYLNNKESGDGTIYNIYKRHLECIECPFERVTTLDFPPLILSNVPHYQYRLAEINATTITEKTPYICDIQETFGDFGEFGIYDLFVNRDHCSIKVIKEPVSITFPILTVVLIYCAIFAGAALLFFLWKKFFQKNEESATDKNKKVRVRALDTFRGISIVIMVFVNYGAGGYEFFDHAIWNGLHLADLVFPWFMWIMGACIPISLSSSFKKETPNATIFLNVLKRSIKLFGVGLFLGSGPYLDCMRIFGVLQRFAISYLCVTTICMFLMDRRVPDMEKKANKFLGDVLKLLYGWIAILAILVIHTLILFLVADPDCPSGYLGPGGWHENLKYQKCTGGATGYIDRVILGTHAYPYPTIKDIYHSDAFDPEGILGCLTSIVHVFVGVQAGTILLVYKKDSDRIIRWLCWAIVTGLIGGGLCGFSKEDGVIPVNKNLWSLSFVLVTSCFAFTLLSVCYLLIDVKKWWSGKPFLFAGMNSIIMYIGHSMTYGMFPVRWNLHCMEEHPTHFVMLFENLWGTGFWVVVSYYLYKINYFFSL